MKKIIGKGFNLSLSVSNVEREIVIKQVQEICDLWNTSYKVLKTE